MDLKTEGVTRRDSRRGLQNRTVRKVGEGTGAGRRKFGIHGRVTATMGLRIGSDDALGSLHPVELRVLASGAAGGSSVCSCL